MKRFMVGIDIGGTFTDCVVSDGEGDLRANKAHTTPANPADGFFNALGEAAASFEISTEELLASSRLVVHGTTTGTNAVVSRSGARVGLIASAGHGEAILHMRGGGRTKGLGVDAMLDLPSTDKPVPLVPRNRIQEVAERVDVKGTVVAPLDEADAERAVQALVDQGVDSIAIALLWSFKNAAHEQRVREIVQEVAPDMFVTCSSDVAPRMGEYARTVGTVINAYIGPLMHRYVREVDSRAKGLGLDGEVLMAQAIGGCTTPAAASNLPLVTIDSGPVSGVSGSATLGPRLGYRNVITTDMGGTTFDVGIVQDGQPIMRDSMTLNQYEMHLHMVDVTSIGAGGGSIAWIDPASGTMRVGPQSAGSAPGPICYGRGGTQPTVTDANVVLGILDPDYFLGGREKLDGEAAYRGMEELGAKLGLGVHETASGILRIVDNSMANEIRRMTLFKGLDPRDMVIFSFGGAGPMHATAYGSELGVEAVVVPLADIAAAWSALGTFAGDIVDLRERADYLREPFDVDGLAATLRELEAEGREWLGQIGFSEQDIFFEITLGMKYGAQVYDIEVSVDWELLTGDGAADRVVAAFERAYSQRFGEGSGYRPAGVEIIRQRVASKGRLPELPLPEAGAEPDPLELGPAQRTTRRVYWPELQDFADTPVIDGEQIRPGMHGNGPLVLEFPHTTVPVRAGQRLKVDTFGSLVVEL